MQQHRQSRAVNKLTLRLFDSQPSQSTHRGTLLALFRRCHQSTNSQRGNWSLLSLQLVRFHPLLESCMLGILERSSSRSTARGGAEARDFPQRQKSKQYQKKCQRRISIGRSINYNLLRPSSGMKLDDVGLSPAQPRWAATGSRIPPESKQRT